MSETITEAYYPEFPQGKSPNFDELEAAAEDLSPDAPLEAVAALAVKYAAKRTAPNQLG